MNFTRAVLSLLFCIALVIAAPAASVSETQNFLHHHHHAWLPYPFPGETDANELARLLDYDFDTIGLSFAGSFHGGDIDFSALDAAINLVSARGKTVVLNLAPRFDETDGVFDRLSDGSLMTNVPNRSPNYAMIDVFDPPQRQKFCQWIELCARRYGTNQRVAAFVIGWGYMGETGYFIGDYLRDFNLLGTVASGYSDHALHEFNRWRKKQGLPELSRLPLPALAGPDRDYILFHQFRNEFAGNVFQKEALARAKNFTRKPVGIFGYISVNAANYGRDWAPTPNADFYRSAVSAASFDLSRSLLDAGVGWEDHELHDGPWNFTVACLERDLARQMARGAVFHAMPVRVYDTEPHWEHHFFPRIASFLLTNTLARQVRATPPDTALFQPTWSAAALPPRGPSNLFVPTAGAREYCSKMAGLAESFGLSYQLVTERDLLEPDRLRPFQHIIVPLWDLMPVVLGERAFHRLARDPRIAPIPTGPRALTRKEFRRLLSQYKIPARLDFDSDRILAGRVNNLIFNWNDRPMTVEIPESRAALPLQPMAWRFIKE